MAKRRRKRGRFGAIAIPLRRLRGLGDLNPDAGAAVREARKGQCRLANKYLYDASPQNQYNPQNNPAGFERAVKDHKIASMIVAQLCTKPAKGRGSKRYRGAGFEGSRRRRRKRR